MYDKKILMATALMFKIYIISTYLTKHNIKEISILSSKQSKYIYK